MTLPVALAGVVIALAPICWIVATLVGIRYWRTEATEPGRWIIQLLWLTWLVIAIVVSLFAGVFVNNSFFDPLGTRAFASMVITRTAIALFAIPTFILLWRLLTR